MKKNLLSVFVCWLLSPSSALAERPSANSCDGSSKNRLPVYMQKSLNRAELRKVRKRLSKFTAIQNKSTKHEKEIRESKESGNSVAKLQDPPSFDESSGAYQLNPRFGGEGLVEENR